MTEICRSFSFKLANARKNKLKKINKASGWGLAERLKIKSFLL